MSPLLPRMGINVRQVSQMFTLVRHHRYEIKIGSESQILRIEELVSGPDVWGGTYRLVLLVGDGKTAKTIYGATADEVANRAVELMTRERFCNPPGPRTVAAPKVIL